MSTPNTDIEAAAAAGGLRRHRGRRGRRRPPITGSSETTTDGSLSFSESDSEDQSWHSPVGSTNGGSYDEGGLSTEIDLESGELELKVHVGKVERECRICHLNLVTAGSGGDQDGMVAIELGCCCKGDLGAAHKQCAETWFKIKGNTTCEICGATACNVDGEQTNEANNATEAVSAVPPATLTETRNVCQGRRIMNFLLTCMVFAFIISWLFHFNILP